jgi:signal transduction histidine kinase
VDVSVTGSPIPDGAGSIDGYCVLSVDISRRRRAEHEIAEALDGERQRIGRELHDTLGQQITAIGLLLNTLKSETELGPPSATTLHNLEDLVRQVKAQLRMLIKGVFPVAVDSAGLLWALYELAHETSELFGVSCRVENDAEVAVADNFQATELYWIAREALHNAVHHGRARDITISLRAGEELVLAVEDNGVGIPARLDETRTLGLRTMRHRSTIIGGRFSVARGPRGGTVVRCFVPLDARPRGR